MLLLFPTVILLLSNHGQRPLEAVANLKLAGTSTSVGTLRFVQRDANSPVVVSGVLTSLSANSNHVCLNK